MTSRFALVALGWLTVIGATAATTNDLSDAKIQGRNLARQLCDVQPAENFNNTGVAKIRSGQGIHYDIPVRFQTIVTATKHLSKAETRIWAIQSFSQGEKQR